MRPMQLKTFSIGKPQESVGGFTGKVESCFCGYRRNHGVQNVIIRDFIL